MCVCVRLFKGIFYHLIHAVVAFSILDHFVVVLCVFDTLSPSEAVLHSFMVSLWLICALMFLS